LATIAKKAFVLTFAPNKCLFFMVRTILFLVATLLALPVVSYYFDAPLAPDQQAMLLTLIKIKLGVALGCFAISEVSKNYSQVDKLWSILPAIYVWLVADAAGYSARLCLMAALVTLWAARLTFNFARRGGYHWLPWKGEEDYRWAVLRKEPPLNKPWTWTLFNLFFISIYQNTLILLFTLPSIVAWQGNDTPLNWLDGLAALGMLAAIFIETIADQQQYNFQKEKYRRIAAGEPLGDVYGKGFCTTGLWRLVRHPNYSAEQATWLFFYLFSVAASGRWLNWSLAGGILLLLLFQGSSDFSEKISASKYPAYADYQKSTRRFI
jgi:steroid 5-alpha reductase family enzyme